MSRPRLWAPLALPPLPTSLLLVSAAVGLLVLSAFAALTLIPLVVLLGGVILWVVVTLLLGWAGIEALAACERWMERHPRFQR
ncbi:MAG: glypican [Cyanobacteriota bacterium]